MTTKNVLPRIAKGKKPIYLDERASDNLMAMVLTLTQELSVLRDRLDTIEQLIEKNGLFTQEVIENFQPQKDSQYLRSERRSSLLDRVLLPIQKELESD